MRVLVARKQAKIAPLGLNIGPSVHVDLDAGIKKAARVGFAWLRATQTQLLESMSGKLVDTT